ncbi:MAG: CBS domain-containing protein [Longimicrobiales bacterium]
MEELTQLRDIMVPIELYPSVRDTGTLGEAMGIIATAQLEVELRKSLPRCLLVFDGIGVLVGYIRRRDIMRGLEPRFLVSRPLEYRDKPFDIAIDPNLAELPFDHMVHGIREQFDRPISDVMRPIEAILEADDHVMKAVAAMVSQDLSLIPVVDKKELVGVIRSVDVFNELAELLE